jgi:acyl-CoA thioesterase
MVRKSDNKETADIIASLKAGDANEPIASFLGMKLIELTPGYAKVSMKLKPEYRNFNGLVFGGIIMAVADQAFAYATNSIVHPSVASQVNIYFTAGADIGDELIGECRVIKKGRLVSVSEMTVTNGEGKLIAKATGETISVAQKRS